MKLDSSNKRVSNIIAGILLAFVAFVFIATALGVVGDHLYIQDRMNPLKRESNLVDVSSDLSLSEDIGKNDFVSIAQNFPDVAEYQTEPGYVSNIQDEFVDGFGAEGYPAFEFPIFIDPSLTTMDTLFESWYKVVEVKGGYKPCDCAFGVQRFNLTQDADKDGNWETVSYTDASGKTTWIGWGLTWIPIQQSDINIGSVDLSSYGHLGVTLDPQIDWNKECRTYYVAIIDYQTCMNIGKVVASVSPDGDLLGKEIKLSLQTSWTGCPAESQHFVLILVQISRIPNSRINM
jgi:hypothetical protein